MTEEKNINNMEKCPRWENCSIPKCPLDYFMLERIELAENEKCILIAPRGKRVSGNIRGNFKRIIGKYVWNKNRSRNIPLPTRIVCDKGELGVK